MNNGFKLNRFGSYVRYLLTRNSTRLERETNRQLDNIMYDIMMDAAV
jgi:hypothetical protein